VIIQTLIYFVIVLLILSVIFLLGPRLNMNVQLKTINLPDDLDVYLHQNESQFNDITSNTEKQIIWANNTTKATTDISIVYVHGFSASRQEMSPLFENMAKDMGANIYFTRLTGHARSNDAMSEVTLNSMLNDAVEALEIGKRIGEQVILVGNSTGATLISWLLSTQNSERVAAMILLSPNYGLKDPKSRLLELPWARYFLPIVEGPNYRFTPDNDIQKKYWTYEYPVKALFPLMALVTLTNKLELEKINTPVLMMYSEEDTVVDVEKIKSSYLRFASPEKHLVVVKNAQGRQSHVLAGDALSPGTTEFVNQEIQKFISRIVLPH